jgi:hypothetical protein
MKMINILAFFFLACSGDKPFKEGSYVIGRNQTVSIAQLDMSIKNNGCGRSWINDGNKPGFEVPYCDLEITKAGQVTHTGRDFKPIYIGNVMVQLQRINPWERTEDSIPAGGCRIFIQLQEGR